MLHLALYALLACQPNATASMIAQKEFVQYNKQWFGGKLTNTEVVVCEGDTVMNNALADIIPPHMFGNESDQYIIEISAVYNLALRQMQLTLFHEMVHDWLFQTTVGYDGSHNEAFHHRMRVLAAEGAFDELW